MRPDRPEREDEEEGGKEFGLEAPGGFKLRGKGYRTMDLVCLMTGAGVVALAYYVSGYAGEYEKNTKAVLQSNQQIIQTLKENHSDTTQVLKQLTQEIKRGNDLQYQAQKESICLQDPVMKNRQDAREVCRRLSRSNARDDSR